LTQGVLRTMLVTKLKLLTGTLVLLAVLGSPLGAWTLQTFGQTGTNPRHESGATGPSQLDDSVPGVKKPPKGKPGGGEIKDGLTIQLALVDRGFRLVAKVCQGDPLGSVQAGDVKVLGSLSGSTAINSEAWFSLYYTVKEMKDAPNGQLVPGYWMRTNFES